MKKWLWPALLLFAVGLAGCTARGPSDLVTGEQTVTLTLADAPASPGQPVPPDMPKGNVKVSLPLFPGAKTTKADFRMPFELIPGSPYLKIARARYVLPVTRETALTWYRQRLQEAGFTESGNGSNDDHGMVVATGVVFESPQDRHLQVILSFEEQGRQTLLQYLITGIAVPFRPAESLIPAGPLRAQVLFYPLQSEPQTIRGTITDTAALDRVVQAVNSLERDFRGIHGCVNGPGQDSVLTFVTRSGETQEVRFRSACGWVKVGDTLLWDPQGQVDKAVAAAFAKP